MKRWVLIVFMFASIGVITTACGTPDPSGRNRVIEEALNQAYGFLGIPTGQLNIDGSVLAYLKKAEAAGLVEMFEGQQGYWDSFLSTTQGTGRPFDVIATPKLYSISVDAPKPPTPSGISLKGDLVAIRRISPDYFRAMGIPLIAGRFFIDTDNESSAKVVILTQTTATKYFEGNSAIGATIDVDGPGEIVGIVGDRHASGPEGNPRPDAVIYCPISSDTSRNPVTLRVKIQESSVDKIVTDDEYKGPLAGLGEKHRLVLGIYRRIPTSAAVVAGAGMAGQDQEKFRFRCVVRYSDFKKEWSVVAIDAGSVDPERWFTDHVK